MSIHEGASDKKRLEVIFDGHRPHFVFAGTQTCLSSSLSILLALSQRATRLRRHHVYSHFQAEYSTCLDFLGYPRYSGGNAYNPQPIPEWQKGINNFFKAVSKPQDGEGSSSGDGSSSGGGSSSSGGGSSSSGRGSSSSSSSSGGVDGCGGSSSNIISEERPGSSMSNNGTSCSFNKNGMISDDSDDD
nr:dermokine-like [Cherax quadricarinatus]